MSVRSRSSDVKRLRTPEGNAAWGAYGLRITGLEDAERHLAQVPATWPEFRLDFEQPAADRKPQAPGTIHIDDSHAELWLAEAGCIELRRDPLSVSFATAAPLSADAILHPFLGLPAAIANRWLGRIALHGGAFAHAGHAWALLGEREAGKSGTLAHLLQRGHHVLSDDVLIVDRTTLFAGPRSIDLREDAAAEVGGEPLGVVGNRSRWRLRPAPGPAALPLGGLIELSWGDGPSIEPLNTESRLRLIISSCALTPDPGVAAALLEVAALPGWRLTRRRRLSELAGAIDLLLPELTAA